MLDLCFQVAYKCAYQMMRVYWRVTRPSTHGALVAVWHEGQILMVKNSYVNYYSLPGGYVRANESAKSAAVRELREEISVDIKEDQLVLAVDVTREWEGKQDRVELFQLDVDSPPHVQVDNREVVAAGFYRPERALEMNLFPALREHIETRMAAAGSAS